MAERLQALVDQGANLDPERLALYFDSIAPDQFFGTGAQNAESILRPFIQTTTLANIEPICLFLAKCYSSSIVEETGRSSRLPVLSLLPDLLLRYLRALAAKKRQAVSRIEDLLLVVFNTEVTKENSLDPDINSPFHRLRVPSLMAQSIYHDPFDHSTKGILNAHMLKGLNDDEDKSTHAASRSLPRLPGSFRPTVLCTLISCISFALPILPQACGVSMCNLATAVASDGFWWSKTSARSRRITIDSDLAVLMVRNVFLCAFRGCFQESCVALFALERMCAYRCWEPAIIACRSALHIVAESPAHAVDNNTLSPFSDIPLSPAGTLMSSSEEVLSDRQVSITSPLSPTLNQEINPVFEPPAPQPFEEPDGGAAVGSQRQQSAEELVIKPPKVISFELPSKNTVRGFESIV